MPEPKGQAVDLASGRLHSCRLTEFWPVRPAVHWLTEPEAPSRPANQPSNTTDPSLRAPGAAPESRMLLPPCLWSGRPQDSRFCRQGALGQGGGTTTARQAVVNPSSPS